MIHAIATVLIGLICIVGCSAVVGIMELIYDIRSENKLRDEEQQHRPLHVKHIERNNDNGK